MSRVIIGAETTNSGKQIRGPRPRIGNVPFVGNNRLAFYFQMTDSFAKPDEQTEESVWDARQSLGELLKRRLNPTKIKGRRICSHQVHPSYRLYNPPGGLAYFRPVVNDIDQSRYSRNYGYYPHEKLFDQCSQTGGLLRVS
jgi:hypothetical protein